MEDKKDRFEITELFMYKAGQNWHRRFMGTIKRMVGDDGKHFVCGSVQVNDCLLYAQADNEEQLGEKLDEMALITLDTGIHKDAGLSTEIFGFKFFLN
jgi:hypothetical protein